MHWLELIYLMIPCYIANMVPVLVRKLPWDIPVDFGLKWRGKSILGSHKTWKGLICGVFAALFGGILMRSIYWPFNFSVIHWSLLTGFGALVGDMVKSFFKRRFRIPPGRPWIPFDEIDFSIGALLFGSLIFFPGWAWSLFIIAFSFVGHIIINHAAFYLRIRKEKW